MADKLLQGALFERAETADAFPLGGHVYRAPIGAATPSSLDGIIAGAGSLFMLRVPAGRTLYVGHRDQVAGKSGDEARGLMFELDAGTWSLALTDDGQATLRLLGDAAFLLKLLAAATVDGTA